MLSIEKKIIDWMIKYKEILFFVIITLISLYVRYDGRGWISGDVVNFLVPWYEHAANNGGFDSLSVQVGDYGLLYQTIIVIMTKIGYNAVYQYKILSILFDYLLAGAVGVFVCKIKEEKLISKTFVIAYGITIMLPTIVFNGAYWGQCDSIYSFFLLMSIIYFIDDKYVRSFIFWGVAFSFKLQAIWILPFYLVYYVVSKKYSILYYFIPVVVYWASGIVCYIKGRGLLDGFKIYASQTSTYTSMYMNARSFWNLIPKNSPARGLAIGITVVMLGYSLLWAINNKSFFEEKKNCILYMVWSVWAVLFFLPTMHERYAYFLDVVIIVLALIDYKYIKYAVVSVVFSLISYCGFLFSGDVIGKMDTIIELAVFILFTYEVFRGIGNYEKDV